MSTLAPGSRIRVEEVEHEKERLRLGWSRPCEVTSVDGLSEFLSAEEIAKIDPFDRQQLAFVIHTL